MAAGFMWCQVVRPDSDVHCKGWALQGMCLLPTKGPRLPSDLETRQCLPSVVCTIRGVTVRRAAHMWDTAALSTLVGGQVRHTHGGT